ncbi:unnamed protein product [Hymenolepis diminuta]|uniref:Uncharacterized protein n=1 Tax=Hymenolepis diminuta TaxID=6216 RepID=A0A564YV09_HYMDI|nr:unnamed protein product [Hymenolepis diminuta]
MQSSMPKAFLSRPASEFTVPKQQSVQKSGLLDHQTNEICCPKGHKAGCFTLSSSETQESFTTIKSQNVLVSMTTFELNLNSFSFLSDCHRWTINSSNPRKSVVQICF